MKRFDMQQLRWFGHVRGRLYSTESDAERAKLRGYNSDSFYGFQ